MKIAWKRIFQYVFFVCYLTALAFAMLLIREKGTVPSSGTFAQEFEDSLRKVLPPFDNKPIADSFKTDGLKVFRAFQTEVLHNLRGEEYRLVKPSGYAFKEKAEGTYGSFELLIGVNSWGEVTGVVLLRDDWPFGIGDILKTREEFFEAFKGKKPQEIYLVGQGGEIPVLTGNFAAAEDITRAVRQGVQKFMANEDLFIYQLRSYEHALEGI